MTWARWYENGNNRIVAKTQLGHRLVSTVFLALDHAFGGGPPILWETMVFPNCDQMERCAGSREQAEAMHAKWVAKIETQVEHEHAHAKP